MLERSASLRLVPIEDSAMDGSGGRGKVTNLLYLWITVFYFIAGLA